MIPFKEIKNSVFIVHFISGFYKEIIGTKLVDSGGEWFYIEKFGGFRVGICKVHVDFIEQKLIGEKS